MSNILVFPNLTSDQAHAYSVETTKALDEINQAVDHLRSAADYIGLSHFSPSAKRAIALHLVAIAKHAHHIAQISASDVKEGKRIDPSS
ncbi:MAG TPA: hypothetical protein VEZ24_09975 [Microvirga sp.]|nr:hypothetical protein [Microvirga sp.]